MLVKVRRLGMGSVYLNTSHILTIDDESGIVVMTDGTECLLTRQSVRELLEAIAREKAM